MLTDRGHNEDPSWAPDGRHIVFASDRDGGGLFVLDSVTGTIRPLLRGRGFGLARLVAHAAARGAVRENSGRCRRGRGLGGAHVSNWCDGGPLSGLSPANCAGGGMNGERGRRVLRGVDAHGSSCSGIEFSPLRRSWRTGTAPGEGQLPRTQCDPCRERDRILPSPRERAGEGPGRGPSSVASSMLVVEPRSVGQSPTSPGSFRGGAARRTRVPEARLHSPESARLE